MQKADEIKFKPTFNVLLNKLFGGGILLLGVIFITWLLFSPKIRVEVKVLLTVMLFPSLYYFIDDVLYSYSAYLIVSNLGIKYSEPYFSVTCDWNDITGIVYTNTHLELMYNKNARINQFTIIKKLSSTKNVPLHNFIKEFRKKENWQTDPLLLSIEKHIPNISNEILNTI